MLEYDAAYIVCQREVKRRKSYIDLKLGSNNSTIFLNRNSLTRESDEPICRSYLSSLL
jgi:hypothetical protein